jgi:hypothetical protein
MIYNRAMSTPAYARPSSGAVRAAAVIAILGSVLLLLCALFGLAGVVMMQNMPDNPAARQPEFRYAGFLGVAFVLGGGVWGLVSGIGLVRYRNWARVSTLIWSGLAVPICGIALLFVSSIKLPVPPNAAEGAESFMRVFVAVIYGLPMVIGIWWLILFTRKPIAALFTSSAGAPGALLDASGFPTTMAKPRAPLPVLIVAWFLIVSAVLSPVLLVFRRFPLLFLGHVYRGRGVAVFFFVSAAISLVAGLGVLKLRPWGFWLTVSWQAFGLLNGTVSLLSPNYDSLIREIRESSTFGQQQPYSVPVQSYRVFGAMGLLLVAVILVILLYYRSHFLAPSYSQTTDRS